jgi:hypothetical protein
VTPEQFDETLRQFLRREPFEPFVVERLDGTVVEVKIPKLAFGGGVAGFISEEDGIVSFDHDQVRTIRPANQKAAS